MSMTSLRPLPKRIKKLEVAMVTEPPVDLLSQLILL